MSRVRNLTTFYRVKNDHRRVTFISLKTINSDLRATETAPQISVPISAARCSVQSQGVLGCGEPEPEDASLPADDLRLGARVLNGPTQFGCAVRGTASTPSFFLSSTSRMPCLSSSGFCVSDQSGYSWGFGMHNGVFFLFSGSFG